MSEYIMSERGSFGSVLVKIGPGETFVSESGAMFRASDNVDIDVTTRNRSGGGGLMSGVRRMMAGESFFLSTYRTRDGAPGEVALAPTLAGEVAFIECRGGGRWLCAGGSFLGASQGLDLDTQFQGLRGALSGESLSFLAASGVGELLVSAFGSVQTIEVDGKLTVDTGHVVAFQDTLEYSLDRAGGSWIQSFLASEGVVLNFSGRGTVYVQSHNPDEFGRRLGGMMPPR